MGYIEEYRNGYFSTAVIEIHAEFAGSCEMIGVIVSPTAMRVLNNKTYFSSPRFFNMSNTHKYSKKSSGAMDLTYISYLLCDRVLNLPPIYYLIKLNNSTLTKLIMSLI